MSYDFSGWATKNDVRCSDGRVIRSGAFKDCDGARVPLVWQHVHDNPNNVLGHADLEVREDGVYANCSLNDTVAGRNAAEFVKHGDVTAMSIYANQLRQNGSDVIHGVIREVSLVLAGANPEARIENLSFAHSDGTIDEIDEEAIIYSGAGIVEEDAMQHSDDSDFDWIEELSPEQQYVVYSVIAEMLGDDDLEHSDDDMPNLGDVFDSLSRQEREEVYDAIGEILDESGIDIEDLDLDDDEDEDVDDDYDDDYDEDEEEYEDDDFSYEDDEPDGDDSMAQSSIPVEEGNIMRRNVFEGVTESVDTPTALSHSEIEDIFKNARRLGSLKDAFNEAGFEDVMAAPEAGDSMQHGITDIDILFPEVHNVTPQPAIISRPMEWVSVVMNGTRKSPFNRIKSTAANLTEEEARARGYIKGKKKIEEQIKLLKRATTPQTIYKLQKFDRDDIIDITDLDVVAWIKREMRTMLNEEIARAILVGDGRTDVDESKIKEDNIRPIRSDGDTYAIHYRTSATKPKTKEELENFIDSIIRAKKDYRGSGNPIMFIGTDLLTEMRLLRDADGYRRYKTDQELADDLRVSRIVDIQLLDQLKPREVGGKQLEFGAIIVNLSDYTVGANKGGQVTLFDDFDIDYNKYSYLIETRMCGCLTQPMSALVFEFGEAAD